MNWPFKRIRKFLLVLLFLIIALGSYGRWLDFLEFISFDWRMKLRGKQFTSEDIAIIEIGNDSLQQIGRWPFDRLFHAKLIDALYEFDAKKICFDITFEQETANKHQINFIIDSLTAFKEGIKSKIDQEKDNLFNEALENFTEQLVKTRFDESLEIFEGVIESNFDKLYLFREQTENRLSNIEKKEIRRLIGLLEKEVEKIRSDIALVTATKKAKNVYYPYGGGIGLIDGLKKYAKGTGHIIADTDIDGKRRLIRAFLKEEDKVYPQLSVKVALDYLNKKEKELNLPFIEREKFIINYAGTWKDTFKHYSYLDILASASQINKGKKPVIDLAKELKDKVCFIGLTATGTHDYAPIPLEVSYPMLGANVNIFNSIITGNYIRRINRWGNLLVLCLIFLLAVSIARKYSESYKWGFKIGGLLIGFIFISMAVFVLKGIWIDLIFPSLILTGTFFSLLFFSYLQERQKHLFLEHDLEIAARLQQGFLSRSMSLKEEGIEIAGCVFPCRYIGGDFYDIVRLDNDCWAIFIGDVTGKGVPASLYMAISISVIRSYIKLFRHPAKVLESVNMELRKRYPSGIFSTAMLLILDKYGNGYFSNAGHVAMYHNRKNNVLSLDAGGGMPLGINEAGDYSQMEINLEPKDIVVLCTDGVLEAKKKGGEVFGENRLVESIKKNDFLSASVLTRRISQAVLDYLQPDTLTDDLTIVAIKKN